MPNSLYALIKIISIAIVSWILVHFLALFGVFVALIYPVWWLLMPAYTRCLVCNSSSEGKYCSFCERQVSKNNLKPSTLISAVKNGGLIFLFSLISFGLVVLESILVGRFLLPIFQARTAVVHIGVPNSDKYFYLNDVISIPLTISGINQAINAVQIDLTYDRNLLQGLEILTDNSFASIFVDKIIDHELGYVRISGGIPNPGFDGEEGLFATVIFRTIRPGTAKVDLLPSSMVLANDGRGSNVLSKIDYGTNYFILPDFRPDGNLQGNVIEPVAGGASSVAILFDFSENQGVVLGESVSIEEEKVSFWESFLVKLSQSWLAILWQKTLEWIIWLDNFIIAGFFRVSRAFVEMW